MDRLVRLARWFGANPAAQLVVGGLVLMVAFPGAPIGTIGRLVVYGALGAAFALGWPAMPAAVRTPPPRIATAVALGVVALVGLSVFWPVLSQSPSPEWQTGDWGPQHAVLARIMPHLPGLDIPVWNHAVSTGDAPLELYPAFTYIVTGHLALLFGLENDLPHAFMIVATLTHLGLALTTVALAMRVASKPIAMIVGIFFLVDSGAISHGGTVGLFHWALLHSAFAHLFSMIAALGILAALRRPRLGASMTIWLGIAVSTAAHPAALITTATYCIALAMVALLASDVQPRRALAAMGHVVIGLALGATVWMPAAERLLEYGQHFPNELYTPDKLLELLGPYALPITAYSFIVYSGHLGTLFGMWTRRANVIFIAIIVLVMMLGLSDGPYLALGLAPSKMVARLGAIRMMLLVRPFVFAAAAFTFHSLVRRAREAWVGAGERQRVIAAVLLAIMIGCFSRVVPEYWTNESDRALGEANQYAPDLEGQNQLEQWAEQQAAQITPERWARAMFEVTTHEHMHLTAKTGLPSFHLTPIPDLLLRERIEDASPESLARFNVRWVVGQGASPQLGDPATEKQFGIYHVREVKEWDGKFARIERGVGTVRVTRLDDEAVEIDVDAQAPVLVALGMGYYPRWRATHAGGANEPVFAMPTIQGGSLHVVAAWVAPGHTTFTCDGRLPSDGKGRFISLLAALFAVAAIIVWRRARWRVRVLRRAIWLRDLVRARWQRVIEMAVPAVLIFLVVVGAITQRQSATALLVGSSGIRPTAHVEARFVNNGEWETCGFSPFTGAYRCPDLVNVSDATVNLMNDAPPSWAFITPAINAYAETAQVEIRITRTVRLGGRYWLGSSYGNVKLLMDNSFAHEFGAKSTIDIPRGQHTIELTTQLPDDGSKSIVFVAERTLVPERTFLVEPPLQPPASVSAIAK
ncbi:MAG TPA: hypothetical protein VFV99_06505 [Kofleriaceae bacterium]|nr:hypothetical protein [Kofleriaceae bacterium]